MTQKNLPPDAAENLLADSRTTLRWVFAAIIDWIAIVAGISLSYISLWFIPVSMLIIGNRQHALGILGHDGAHQLVVRRHKVLNNWLTNLLAFWPLGLSLKEFRKFHWDHHRHVNSERDPELALKNTWPNPIAAPVTTRKVVGHGICDLLGMGATHSLRFFWCVRPRSLSDCGAIVALFGTCTVLILNGIYLAPLLWLSSIVITFWFWFRLRVWTEHVGLGEGETHVLNPPLWMKLLILPHSTWCHHSHHEHPGIPFSKLPDAGR
jgi:fatty acid desaturase